jgi:pyruvyltransferase
MLTPVILAVASGRPVIFSDESNRTDPRWLVAGSILAHARPGDVVCGTGSFDGVAALQGVDVIALRGPITASRAGVPAGLMGDAGLMMPCVYDEARQKKFALGIVPHYVDLESVAGLDAPDTAVISVWSPVREFISRLRECSLIAASSLHGLVLAEAYGIPAIRIRFPSSSAIRDFELKHEDYYEGTGRKCPAAISLEDVRSGCTEAPDSTAARLAGASIWRAMVAYMKEHVADGAGSVSVDNSMEGVA